MVQVRALSDYVNRFMVKKPPKIINFWKQLIFGSFLAITSEPSISLNWGFHHCSQNIFTHFCSGFFWALYSKNAPLKVHFCTTKNVRNKIQFFANDYIHQKAPKNLSSNIWNQLSYFSTHPTVGIYKAGLFRVMGQTTIF